MIAPNGDIGPIQVTENQTEYGQTKLSRPIVDPILDALTVDYARAIFLEGGAGPLSVQLRQNRDGTWKVVEINLRTVGTFGRFLLGVDYLGFIIKAFVPGASFPELHLHDADRCDQVGKQYYSYPVFDSNVAILKSSGVWSRS